MLTLGVEINENESTIGLGEHLAREDLLRRGSKDGALPRRGREGSGGEAGFEDSREHSLRGVDGGLGGGGRQALG